MTSASYWKINELISEFPDITIIESNEIFSLPIQSRGGRMHTLLINLPPSPQEGQPLLFCDPIIPENAMIEPDGRVLLEPGMGRDGDLVGIIKRIIVQPRVEQQAVMSNPSLSTLSTSQLNQKDLDLLQSLNEEQCATLLSNEELFQKFLANNMTSVREQVQMIEQMKAEVIERAKSNLSLKKEIQVLSKELDQVEVTYGETLQSYQNFLVLNSSALNDMKPDSLFSQLQVSLMDLNELSSESLKKVINDGDPDKNLDLELKECIKLRKEYHKKAILLQKFHEDST